MGSENMKIGVLGAGTWGVALAALLCKNGNDVTVWSAIPEEIDELCATNRHKNLKGAKLPEKIVYTKDVEAACRDKQLVLFVVPSSFIRQTARLSAPYFDDGVIIASASKGIESGSLKTMTEIIEEELRENNPALSFSIAAISGPTHAEEVAMGLPTSIVAASADENVSSQIVDVFVNSCMRVYTNTDVLGVEICGALKNIIAIAAGINLGMGFGDNSKAMLMTRGAHEMTRLGLAMGCRRRTFMGLAGFGDLIVTCTSVHSRNNRCGELIGKGMSYEEAVREIGMVVEGYHALDAAMGLSEKYGVEMPIASAVYNIIKHGVSPEEAMASLMSRDSKSELDL